MLTVTHDKPLGTAQLARLTGVDGSTVRKWINEGLKDGTGAYRKLPTRRVGKRHRIDWPAYEQWQRDVFPGDVRPADAGPSERAAAAGRRLDRQAAERASRRKGGRRPGGAPPD